MQTENYIAKSLELHLFFGRIMKEHALFLKAGLTPVNASFSKKAGFYKNEFEKLLNQAVMLGNGNISHRVLCSGELVTDFTLPAERQTEGFTGIAINKDITKHELNLVNRCPSENVNTRIYNQIRRLNQKAIILLNGLITLKEQILNNVLCCKMFTMNYPLLIEHIIREARLYRDYVTALEKNGCLTDETMQNTECFWNQIMMEHALFIRGLLDPAENELIQSADGFAKEYADLLKNCNRAQNRTITSASLEETIKFRDFKTAGTKGIAQCQIRSVILPLLADHVLREANHYIRLLMMG